MVTLIISLVFFNHFIPIYCALNVAVFCGGNTGVHVKYSYFMPIHVVACNTELILKPLTLLI